MKKLLLVLLILTSCVIITGCEKGIESSKETEDYNVVKAKLDLDGNVIINEKDITDEVTYISYKVDDVTISLIAVLGTDNKVRVAFNTCQSCSPSPYAYFIQEGEYVVCQNCGTEFHINKIGEEQGGCNPAPIMERSEENGVIIVSSEYLKTYKEKFENWNGPK